jgi:glycerophosphoryl diester phosphodiesterase
MKPGDSNATALNLLASKRPLVIAHRGYCKLAPENTLPSFKLATTAGADLVELDYHHSKDGKPIVIHDAKLDRTTNARSQWRQKRIKVESRTATELQTLDAGSWFDAKYAGTKIPLLAEALATIQQGSITLIERKTGDPAACIKLLRDMGLINKVVVQAFDWEFLRKFHEQEPRQVLGALGPPALLSGGRRPIARRKTLSPARLDHLQKTGAKIVVWNRHLSKHSVQLAHDRDLKIWVYTIDSPALANRLLDLGVDGLITNDISSIQETLSRRADSEL